MCYLGWSRAFPSTLALMCPISRVRLGNGREAVKRTATGPDRFCSPVDLHGNEDADGNDEDERELGDTVEDTYHGTARFDSSHAKSACRSRDLITVRTHTSSASSPSFSPVRGIQ